MTVTAVDHVNHWSTVLLPPLPYWGEGWGEGEGRIVELDSLVP